MAPAPFMDARTSPLNPCSVETIPEPVKLADGRSVWPLMLSCYELEQDMTSGQQQRAGYMDLSLIEVPDIANHANAMPLQFDKTPYTVLAADKSSGILDGKWSSMPIQRMATDDGAREHESGAPESSLVDSSDSTSNWCFASAHSTGEIRMHSFQVASGVDVGGDTNIPPGLPSDTPLFIVNYLGQSDAPQVEPGAPPPLCLSLRWDEPATYKLNKKKSHSDLCRIVSTYSNGTMAIHDVAIGSGNRVHLIERDSWEAHNMFTSPAEVWSACFAGRNVVLSGGDEGKVKVWDIRATTRPMQVIDEPFEAGVTCLSPHPVQEHIVAVGSYDENVCIFDIRYISRRQPLCKTGNLGGGIWRIKWHPYTENRMLVGAMHGGCCVLDFHGGSCFDGFATAAASPSGSFDEVVGFTETDMTVNCTKKFTEHESMTYGADWLVCPHPTQNGYFEAAASCSFYDRSVFLWDSVF